MDTIMGDANFIDLPYDRLKHLSPKSVSLIIFLDDLCFLGIKGLPCAFSLQQKAPAQYHDSVSKSALPGCARVSYDRSFDVTPFAFDEFRQLFEPVVHFICQHGELVLGPLRKFAGLLNNILRMCSPAIFLVS